MPGSSSRVRACVVHQTLPSASGLGFGGRVPGGLTGFIWFPCAAQTLIEDSCPDWDRSNISLDALLGVWPKPGVDIKVCTSLTPRVMFSDIFLTLFLIT